MTTEFTTEWARHVRVTPNDQRMLLVVSTIDGSDEVRANLSKDEAKTLAAALDPDAGKWLEATEEVLDIERAQHDETRRALADVEGRAVAISIDRDRLRRAFSNANGRAELAEARVRELEKASAATKDGIEKAIKDQLAAEGWHATSVLIDAAVKGVCEYLYPALRKMAWAAPDLPASLPEIWENDSGNWESAGRLMPASSIPRLRALLDNAEGEVAFYTAVARAIENKPPAPHPVEALAEELFKVGHPEFALDWSNVLEHTRDVYRRMARHTIVERKADQ